MMNNKYMLGIDIGTTTGKGVLLNGAGEEVAEADFEHGYETPRKGWFEMNADSVWWDSVCAVIQKLLRKSGIDAGDIISVGCSALYPAVLPLDENGRPLRPAILYGNDTRAVEEIKYLEKRIGREKCIDIAGNTLSSQSPYPKILWLKNHEPEVFAKSKRFVSAATYIVYKLTGEFVVDHGSASGVLPYDLEQKKWSRQLCNLIGITEEQLPHIKNANEAAGSITKEASLKTGLKEGTTVAVGTGDHHAESLSIGPLKKGTAIICYGTTFGVDYCSPVKMVNDGLMLSRTCIGEHYFIGGAMSNGANVTRWFRDVFAQDKVQEELDGGLDAYQSLSLMAKDVPAGSNGLITVPYFNGERSPVVDPSASGMIYGLRLAHSRAEIYRSLIEGVAYGVNFILETMKSSGIEIERAYAVGGGTKSCVWPQIVSDVLGIRQEIIRHNVGAPVGAAILGGMAADMIDEDFLETAGDKSGEIITPDFHNHMRYQEYYKKFKQLYFSTRI